MTIDHHDDIEQTLKSALSATLAPRMLSLLLSTPGEWIEVSFECRIGRDGQTVQISFIDIQAL